MEDIVIDIFNWTLETATAFRASYQGQVLKWLFIGYSLVLVISIVVLIVIHPNLWDYAFWGNKRKKTLEKLDRQKATMPKTKWDRVKAKLNSVNPNDWKIAVIEADKLLDDALKSGGTEGDSMGERLKNVVPGDVGGELDQLWEAHRVRNNLVHDPAFELSSEVARKTVKALEDASKALKGK